MLSCSVCLSVCLCVTFVQLQPNPVRTKSNCPIRTRASERASDSFSVSEWTLHWQSVFHRRCLHTCFHCHRSILRFIPGPTTYRRQPRSSRPVLARSMLCKRGHNYMLSCGVCLSVCLCVCVTVTFVHSVKTNKHIFKIFSPPGSHTILVFPYQTAWQYSDGNPSNGGRQMQVG